MTNIRFMKIFKNKLKTKSKKILIFYLSPMFLRFK